MIFRCILPNWLKQQNKLPPVREGEFTDKQIKEFNEQGYNIYYLPNYPSFYDDSKPVDGSDIDVFTTVFVDMDLKDGKYKSEQEFIEKIQSSIKPSKIVYSGHGVHVYWRVTDLDALSFLKLQRRLMRFFDTDDAVCQIFQLLRYPGTMNTKKQGDYRLCEVKFEDPGLSYTCEELDNLLPILSKEDESYCMTHYNKTYDILEPIEIDDDIPAKFGHLLRMNKEAKSIWTGQVEDRSKGDFRLGHLMYSAGFTREEAMSVLFNSAKSLSRAPKHRISYALNIVNKIWSYEQAEDKTSVKLSKSVKEILTKGDSETLKGVRLKCAPYVDDFEYGFRLGHVLGFIAGSGVGKTSFTLNMFKEFVTENPEYDHFFVSLEQPENEIALRWQKICGKNTALHDKVHVIGNYDDNNKFRGLSLKNIKDYIIKFQKDTGRKVGCVVIDHIGILSGEVREDDLTVLIKVCKEMKTFAEETKTFLIMQSQAPREKAGIGDIELDKDAAFGTSKFENFCDYVVTMWQPLMRCYAQGAPTVTAFKFCKIRHRNQLKDNIKQDVPYRLMFNPQTEELSTLTQVQEESFVAFLRVATNLRGEDKKTAMPQYVSAKTAKEAVSWH